MNPEERVRGYLGESAEVVAGLVGSAAQGVVRAAGLVAEALAGGHRVYLMGNGGSAADAQHVACELVGRFRVEREAWPVVALTTDTSVLTAIANDYGYQEVFARQLAGLAGPGDVVIGFSTSGRSANVLRGLEAARERGATTVGFCGPGTAEFERRCDLVISVAGSASPHIQDGHGVLGHALCDLVEAMLTEGGPGGPAGPIDVTEPS